MEPDMVESPIQSIATGDPVMPQSRKAGESEGTFLLQRRTRRGASRAQAMVEFALALPIFLLVVYGLLEVGRLIFMVAAVATASREGVRYASAWGVNAASTRQYQDCTGIRNAAKNTGFLLGLQNSSIRIGYDSGPSTTYKEYCNLDSYGQIKDTTTSLGPCNRVVVTIKATYQPILPLFVPLTTKNMSSTTRRTVMGVIDLNNPSTCP